MWLHGGRFLNGVCLSIRCCHNTASPAMPITILSADPPLKLSLDAGENIRSWANGHKELTETNQNILLVYVKEVAKDAISKYSDRQSPDVDKFVYMRDSEGFWHLLDTFLVQKSGNNPKLDHSEFIVTDVEGTWPGLRVWVRSHVPQWVVSRDIV
eukprot:GHVU01103595.1.p1 GENE.GHVU01103595.1~~GHVU01103595.1.p1  ORF type:complete len:155 (+),score=10.92 GHVU01103595.1:53-517(+)